LAIGRDPRVVVIVAIRQLHPIAAIEIYTPEMHAS
jgi:hypothetical protein